MAWIILAWYSYAYGRLMYERLGEGAERAFAREWGIALGIDNALQVRLNVLSARCRGIISAPLVFAFSVSCDGWPAVLIFYLLVCVFPYSCGMW